MKLLTILLTLTLMAGCDTIATEQLEEETTAMHTMETKWQGVARAEQSSATIEIGISSEGSVVFDWNGLGEGPTFVEPPEEPDPEPIEEEEYVEESITPHLELPIVFPEFTEDCEEAEVICE